MEEKGELRRVPDDPLEIVKLLQPQEDKEEEEESVSETYVFYRKVFPKPGEVRKAWETMNLEEALVECPQRFSLDIVNGIFDTFRAALHEEDERNLDFVRKLDFAEYEWDHLNYTARIEFDRGRKNRVPHHYLNIRFSNDGFLYRNDLATTQKMYSIMGARGPIARLLGLGLSWMRKS